MAASAFLKKQYPLWNGWPLLLSYYKETLYSDKSSSLQLNTE